METILATFLVSLVIMAIFQVVPGSALAIKRAECKLQSGSIAAAALDAQMARGFAQVASLQGHSLDLPDQFHDGITYRITLTVFDPPNPRPTLLKGIQCTVEWTLGGQDYSITREAWLSAVRGG